MEDRLLLSAGAVFVVTLSISMARLGRRSGGLAWAIAWACLWSSGFFAVVARDALIARAIIATLSTFFTALLFIGACRYAGLTSPSTPFLLAIASGISLLRAALVPVLSFSASQIIASSLITAGVAATCWVLLRPAEGQPLKPWSQVLGSAFPAVAMVSWYYAIGQIQEDRATAPSLMGWLVVGVVLCSLKTGAFVALSQERMRALSKAVRDSRDERERIEARYREVAEHTSDMIGELDSAGRFLYANPAHLEVLGRKPESLIGRPLEDVFQSGDDGLEAWTSGSGLHVCVVPHADGRPVTLECKLRRFAGPGAETRYVLSSRDITARAANERENAEARAALERLVAARTDELRASLVELQKSRRLASMGTMAAGIAHQINNPIGSIQMASEFALSTPRDDRERAGILEDAVANSIEQAKRCGRIVSSMLQFARNEPTEKTREDLSVLVRRSADQTERYAKSLGVRVALGDIHTPLTIRGSAIELEQALLNVLRNACEATEAAGHVRVDAIRSSGQAIVTIEDDGRGMTRGRDRPGPRPLLHDPPRPRRHGPRSERRPQHRERPRRHPRDRQRSGTRHADPHHPAAAARRRRVVAVARGWTLARASPIIRPFGPLHAEPASDPCAHGRPRHERDHPLRNQRLRPGDRGPEAAPRADAMGRCRDRRRLVPGHPARLRPGGLPILGAGIRLARP